MLFNLKNGILRSTYPKTSEIDSCIQKLASHPVQKTGWRSDCLQPETEDLQLLVQLLMMICRMETTQQFENQNQTCQANLMAFRANLS